MTTNSLILAHSYNPFNYKQIQQILPKFKQTKIPRGHFTAM